MVGHLKRWGPLVLFLAVVAVVYATGLNRYCSPAFLKTEHDGLKAFVDSHFLISLVAFTVFFAILTSVAVPGAVFAQLAGGFLFGAWLGGVSIALAATTGALAIYGVTRTAFGDELRRKLDAQIESRPNALGRLQKGLDEHSFWFLLAIRLAPVVPFVLVNIASGLARIPLRRYLLATFLGTLPTNVVYASIGAGLDRMFAEGRELNLALLMDGRVIAPLSALALLSLLPVGARLAWERWGVRRAG